MIVVDGMNVVGSRPDGWWRNRRGAMTELVERLEILAAKEGEVVTVIFDGRSFALPRPGGSIEVRFASRGGPDAADADIVALVERSDLPAEIRVVTSDADLSERVRSLGAAVEGAGEFRRRLDAL
jgi:predicted RNA-binding protein with PIN domain